MKYKISHALFFVDVIPVVEGCDTAIGGTGSNTGLIEFPLPVK